MTDPIVQANVEFLQSRSKAGIEKYGTTLARTDLNLIEWLQHAREEAADLLNYLTKIQRELEWRTDKPPIGQRCVVAVKCETGHYETSGYFGFNSDGFEVEDGGWVKLEDMIAWIPFPTYK